LQKKTNCTEVEGILPTQYLRMTMPIGNNWNTKKIYIEAEKMLLLNFAIDILDVYKTLDVFAFSFFIMNFFLQ
jgi:hypothetical protein